MRHLRLDHPDYELRGATVRRARVTRPCDHPLCARHGIIIGVHESYAYVSTGLAFCDYHWQDADIVTTLNTESV